MEGKFIDVQNTALVNKESELYKRNTHAFFEEDFNEVKSQGSIFDNNKNQFYGVDKPNQIVLEKT